MAPWFRRTLIKGLIGPVAYGVVSVLVCLFYVWFVGNIFSGSNLSGGKKVYKNYIEKFFISEIVADREVALERVLEDSLSTGQKPKEGTFVIVPINGPIFDENVQRIWDQLYIAVKITPNLKAIIFLVDSPGGGVTESDYLFEEIRKIRTRGVKTVVFINSLSASGAYYMTAQSDKIISSPTAIVGSIGVIWESMNIEELSRKLGISVNTIKSSDMKDIGSPFKKMSDDEKIVLRKIIDYNYDRFRSIVQKGRGLSNSQINLVSTGEVWHPEKAKALGLVDEVGYVNRAVDIARELTGVNVPTVVTYEEETTFLDIFGVRSPVVGLIKDLDNTVSKAGIPTPRLLYMWIP